MKTPSLLSLLLSISLLGSSCAHPPQSAVSSYGDGFPYQFSQIYFRYANEESFQRIREYFTGEERAGNRLLVRSDSEVRDGFYFILRLSPGWRDLPAGSQFVVNYIPADQTDPERVSFSLDDRVRDWRGEVFFGLTGEDWTVPNSEPIAWRLQVIDPEGNVLAREKSFLWSDARLN